jgi:hypothetical protein
MADNSIKTNQIWFTGGNGRRAEHGTLQLVAGTAAVLTSLSRFDAVVLTSATALDGTVNAAVSNTVASDGGISPSSGNLLVTSNWTGTANTAIYSFVAIGF